MPEYLRPGVFIQETSFRGKPIQGVSTSTAGFVGAAPSGPSGRPTFCGSFGQFRRIFGDPVASPSGMGDYLGHAVKAFFENGGSRCYVVRSLGPGAAPAAREIGRGSVYRLAGPADVRGPQDRITLNTLRRISADPANVANSSNLIFYRRNNATSSYREVWQSRVAAIDPASNSVTLDAPIPGGDVFSPEDTVILLDGEAPAEATGPVFEARYEGNDGNRISVDIRPRDRSPVALVASGASTVRRADLVLGADAAMGDSLIRFDAASLRSMRVNDTVTIGPDELQVQAIADGAVTFSVVGGGPGANHTAAGTTVALIERGGAALPSEVPLGTDPNGLMDDLTVGGGPFGPSPIQHDLAARLQAGDVVRLTTGPDVTDVTIDAIQVAEEVAPGTHVTLAGPLTAAAPVGTPAQVTSTATGGAFGTRVHVSSVASFEQPNRAGSFQPVTISSDAGGADAEIALADLANRTLYLTGGTYPSGTVTGADWTRIASLGAAAADADTVTVASTASFYTGALVEIDTGSQKVEATVTSIDAGNRTVTFTPALALAAPIDLSPVPDAPGAFIRVHEIDIAIFQDDQESSVPVLMELFDGLTWNSDPAVDASLRYYADRVNDEDAGSKVVSVSPPAGEAATFADAPAVVGMANPGDYPQSLEGGDNGGPMTDLSIIGEDNGPGQRTGIQALAERDDISMVAVPGIHTETVQAALITHCERLKYRVAVLDTPPDAGDVIAIQTHRNNYDSKYAAYYAPWLKALNPVNGRIQAFPPSGFAMGIYARTDNSVGVHKAPANEVVRNITDVDLPLTASEQEVLNPVGVNLIRDLTPRGIRMWGARTISSDQEWKYLNIRRLFIYVEHSIDIGTQWVVFEPNSEALWERVTQTVTSFLTGVWKSGALMGTTPEEGFFVTCDRSTMTQDDIDNGRLVCEIGLAPAAPAEFVIFRIGQFTASST